MRVSASIPNQTPCEDGEPTSIAEIVKNLFKKNKEKILFIGGAAVAVAAGLAIHLAEGQYAHEDIETDTPLPTPAPTPEGQERRAPLQHQVKAALVNIGDRRASARAQANYSRDA